jgi:hypothetical protein
MKGELKVPGIFYKKVCPICDGKLFKTYSQRNLKWTCNSGCYEYSNYKFRRRNLQFVVKIFDETFVSKEYKILKDGKGIDYNRIVQGTNYKEIRDKIKYWKENERYLMRLLLGGATGE